MRDNPLDIIKNKKIEPDFEPTTKTLVRILKTMVEKGADSKTILSLNAQLNYSRLAKHIVWMEAKGLVEAKIDKSVVKIGLTKKGREFASTLVGDLD
jgi:predicted transcriptional regulator